VTTSVLFVYLVPLEAVLARYR